jgi:hypothetical protein
MSVTDHRDIRSAGLPFKRDKDNVEKWSYGVRPSAGTRTDWITGELITASEGQAAKIRPWSDRYVEACGHPLRPPPLTLATRSPQYKPHANKTPKPYANFQQGAGSSKIDARQSRKVDALVDVNDHTSSPLSKSLLELLPQHANNTQSAIQTAIRESAAAVDAEILYSFDNKGPSPSSKGRNVDLGGLVEIAEQKWVNEQTERIVKGEYEVLDHEGETITTKGRGKKSPKQKATRETPVAAQGVDVDDDDGFELV